MNGCLRIQIKLGGTEQLFGSSFLNPLDPLEYSILCGTVFFVSEASSPQLDHPRQHTPATRSPQSSEKSPNS